jgi:Asp-tRNA(Asn)/Glu-tRNA(Gln) amidotransferase A subunit family amidase
VNLTTRKNRGNQFRSARLIPAVDYLQSQRLRTMMMHKLAEATAGVDVYLAPWTGGAIGADTPPSETGPQPTPPQTATQQHYRMANLACYPAVALPTGFSANGSPTSVTFMGQPFKETEVMVLAKAYQDATDFHLKHPVL